MKTAYTDTSAFRDFLKLKIKLEKKKKKVPSFRDGKPEFMFSVIAFLCPFSTQISRNISSYGEI